MCRRAAAAIAKWCSASWVVALAAQVSAATWTDLGTLDMTGIASGTPVRVGGKTTPGDGGHGEFYYDSASSAAPLTGMVYTPAVGSGRILRKYSGMIDVRWFNAAADGATDDTTAIQAAISFAESPTYGWAATARTQVGTVFLPDGTYIVTNLQVKKGIILQGAGIWNTVLKGKTGTTGWLLTFDGSSGSSQINTEGNQVASAVRDIRFDGNNRMANYGCIQLTKMDHLQLENLFIWRFTRAAINCNKSVRESTFRTVKVRFCGNFDATDNNGAGWPAVSVVDQESLLGSAEDTHNGITFNDVQIVYSMGNALEIDTKQIHSGPRSPTSSSIIAGSTAGTAGSPRPSSSRRSTGRPRCSNSRWPRSPRATTSGSPTAGSPSPARARLRSGSRAQRWVAVP